MKRKVLLIARILVVGIIVALYLLGLSYGYSRVEIGYFTYLAIIGAIILPVVLFVTLVFIRNFINSLMRIRKQPSLYDEVTSILHDTLLPLGFEEHEQNAGWVRTVQFSRGKYLLKPGAHMADGEFVLKPIVSLKELINSMNCMIFLLRATNLMPTHSRPR